MPRHCIPIVRVWITQSTAIEHLRRGLERSNFHVREDNDQYTSRDVNASESGGNGGVYSQYQARVVASALALLSSATAAHAAPPTLPPQVPYLQAPSRYVVGSGIAMAVGEPNGDWVQLAGPGYTNHNLLEREHLTLLVDGKPIALVWNIKRAERTGLYYGIAADGDLRFRLVDFSTWGLPNVTRLLSIENTSRTLSHEVHVRADITPSKAKGISAMLSRESATSPGYIMLEASKEAATLFTDHPNEIEGAATISFGALAGWAGSDGPRSYILESKSVTVAANATGEITLVHSFSSPADARRLGIGPAGQFRAREALAQSIVEWQHWFSAVGPKYRLENIRDERARRLVEGALAVIKTNQSADGGFAADLTFFSQGFTRDSILGLKAMSATGHSDELKRWLLWENYKFGLCGHICDATVLSPTLDAPSIEFDMGNIGVEGTALVVLCARDYYNATRDLTTLRSLDRMLRYCIEVQLQQAHANDYRLEFNGDETEVCGAVEIKQAGTLERLDITTRDWSLSSVALAAASVDFYIRYIEATGGNPAAYHSATEAGNFDLQKERARLVAAMDRDFWRTDVPGLNTGFHDAFRIKETGAWPLHRLSNISLMPVYWGTPYGKPEQRRDAAAIAHYFNPRTGFLPLVPEADTGFDGHDLGYLLWTLVETGNPAKEAVYKALVTGPTSDCWGAFSEAYSPDGKPNEHDLRTMETGVNVSAVARYWNLGN